MLCILACVTVVPDDLTAQSMWVNRGQEGGFALEYLRPIFRGNSGMSLLSGIYVVSARTRVSNKIQVVAELPVAHVSFNSSFVGDRSSTNIGNVYLGLTSGSPDEGTSVDMGVHLPTVGEDAEAVALGFLGDYDRFEMYIPDFVSFGVRIDRKDRSLEGMTWRVRFGPTVLLPTGDFGDTEVDVAYGFASGFENVTTTVSLGVTGRWHVTSDGASFGESSIHQITLLGSHRFDRIRVGAQFRIPVDDDLDNNLERVLGLSVTLPFK